MKIKILTLVSFICFYILGVTAMYSQDKGFLLLGGGSNPIQNQVSIEYNAKFFLRSIKNLGFNSPVKTFYSDGNAPTKDIQIAIDDTKREKVNHLLSIFLKGNKGLKYEYRNNEIEGNTGPCKIDKITKALDELMQSDNKSNFVSFFGHGHGGKSEGRKGTTFVTYGEKGLKVNQFSRILNKQKIDRPLTLFMTQCYSGGFADIIFIDGNSSYGLSPKPRCGFFSTVHYRQSTGCTTAVDNPDYVDYGSMFWAAMSGTDQFGKKFKQPDYNDDGKTTMLEAHAYTIIHAKTIDIPFKTSDRLLEHFSIERDPKKLSDNIDKSNYEDLLKNTDAIQKAILTSLAKTCELGPKGDIKTFRSNAKKLTEKIAKISKEYYVSSKKRYSSIIKIKKDILSKWPTLNNPWNSNCKEIIDNNEDEIVTLIENHKAQKVLKELDKKNEKLKNKLETMKYQEAFNMRLLNTYKSIYLENELKEKGSDELKTYLEKIKTLEENALGS
jgi:hypothetical protein